MFTDFERALGTYLAAEGKEVVAVRSAQVALRLALQACGVGQGGAVCVPGLAPQEVMDVVTGTGARAVAVDAEAETWNMDAELLEDAIDAEVMRTGAKPQAVVLTAAYGMPALMHRVLEVCCRRCVPLIEYSAEGLGSEFGGRKLGTYGWHWMSIVGFGPESVLPCGGAALVLDSVDDRRRIVQWMTAEDAMPPEWAERGLSLLPQMDTRMAEHQARHERMEARLRQLDDMAQGVVLRSPPPWMGDDEAPLFRWNHSRDVLLAPPGMPLEGLRAKLASRGISTARIVTALCTGVCGEIAARGLEVRE